VHRGDDADAPVAAVHQVGPGVAGEQKGAREQDGQQRVPAVLVELGDRRDVLEAGVGDDRVEAPEALDGRLDGRAVALARGQVGLEGLARPVGVGLEIDREHAKAVVDQPLCDGTTDSTGGPGHQDRAFRFLTGG
jgi:hypothetical protein